MTANSILCLLASGHRKLKGPGEIITFLVLMIAFGGFMAWSGYRMFRNASRSRPEGAAAAARALDLPFGILLLAVGAFLMLLCLYLLVGGLSGWHGIQDLRDPNVSIGT